jgi:hypothetical protein
MADSDSDPETASASDSQTHTHPYRHAQQRSLSAGAVTFYNPGTSVTMNPLHLTATAAAAPAPRQPYRHRDDNDSGQHITQAGWFFKYQPSERDRTAALKRAGNFALAAILILSSVIASYGVFIGFAALLSNGFDVDTSNVSEQQKDDNYPQPMKWLEPFGLSEKIGELAITSSQFGGAFALTIATVLFCSVSCCCIKSRGCRALIRPQTPRSLP